ncbi:MAG: hypothetical protein ACRDRY_07220 [Pseudonocardiaceae bacterium]
MTDIPYSEHGLMISLRDDHDHAQYHDCWLCSPVPAGGRRQRGCPTTGLPAAPLWRPRSGAAARSGDPLDLARNAVTDLHQRHAAHNPPGVELDRAQQLARWHTDDHAAGEDDRGALVLPEGGAA